MTAYSAFQSNAFQNNAFQILSGGAAPAQQNSAGFPAWDSTPLRHIDHRPLSDRYAERIEALPVEVQDAIEESLNIESPAERGRRLRFKLASVEKEFQAIYITLMEHYRNAFIEEQLIEELKRRQEEDDLALILLLST